MKFKIAYGNSRFDKRWKNNEIEWDAFCARASSTIRTTETVDEYRNLKRVSRTKSRMSAAMLRDI